MLSQVCILIKIWLFFPQTLLNGRKFYLGSMLSAYVVLIIMGCLAFKVAGGTLENLRGIFTKKLSRDLSNTEGITVVSPAT